MSKKTTRKRKKNRIKVVYKNLTRQKVWGLAYMGDNYMEIDNSLKNKRKLSTLVHESVHLAIPSLSESQVRKVERVVSNLLWQENYRRIEQ